MFTVRRPISSDQLLRREGAVVTRHRTLDGARKSLLRQQRGAAKQGGYSQDYLWDDANDTEVSCPRSDL